MQPHHSHYHASNPSAHDDLHQLLASKTFHVMSTETWEVARKVSNQHVYKNELSQLRGELLYGKTAKQFRSPLVGAYHDQWPFFEDIIETYKERDGFLDSTSSIPTWKWKLSWDNRRLGVKNEAWSLAPFSVHHPQSPIHTHLFMHANIRERNIAMTQCVTESSFSEFITELHGSTIYWKGEEIEQRVVLDADWIALCRWFDSPLPNTPDYTARVCWKCGANKEYMHKLWLEDPFSMRTTILPMSTFPNVCIPDFELTDYRYCPMHNMSNVLSDALVHTFDLLEPFPNQHHSFQQIIRSICSKWSPANPLTPHEMKDFFHKVIGAQLVPLFSTHTTHLLHWPHPPYKFVLSTSQLIEMLYSSLTTIHNFHYTYQPTPAHFKCVRVARNCTLSCYHHFKWPQQPTFHYQFSHSIMEAEEDGGAYNILQEGVEHINSQDKRINRHSFHLAQPHLHHLESSAQYVINQYRLRLQFLRLGYQEAPYVFTPASTPVTYTSHPVIMPQHAPI